MCMSLLADMHSNQMFGFLPMRIGFPTLRRSASVRPSWVVVMNLAHTSGDVRVRAEGDGTDGTGWVGLSRAVPVLCFMINNNAVSRQPRDSAQRLCRGASQVTCRHRVGAVTYLHGGTFRCQAAAGKYMYGTLSR